MWQRLAPPAELVIVGRLQRTYPSVRNVTYAGFVADLRDVYTADSVLLTPAFAAGGVKTKVVEAFAYGCPVLGNHATFDGLPLPKSYPLRLPLRALDEVVAQPERHLKPSSSRPTWGRPWSTARSRKVCSSSAGPWRWPRTG